MSKQKITGDLLAQLNFDFSGLLIPQAIYNPKLNKTFESSDILYHYTNLNGLLGIIENQSLYFTNLFYLNDKKELIHGIELIKGALGDIRNQQNELIINLIEKFKEIITQHIDFFESRKDSIDWGDYDYNDLVADSIISMCDALIDSVKHKAFSEENEYRLVCQRRDGGETLKFRSKNNMVVPFIEIQTKARNFKQKKAKGMFKDIENQPLVIDKLPIDKIILGPCLEKEKMEPALRMLLYNNGYKSVEIVESEIPYNPS